MRETFRPSSCKFESKRERKLVCDFKVEEEDEEEKEAKEAEKM